MSILYLLEFYGLSLLFAVFDGCLTTILHGHLLYFPELQSFQAVLKRTDEIEGYSEGNANSLFQRNIVAVEICEQLPMDTKLPVFGVPAYIYSQKHCPTSGVEFFPSGDWMQR